jgi:TonB family protein
MRTLLLAALALSAAAPAAAQTFRLVDPTLTVDNRRVGIVGAPLVQDPFGLLTLSVPGSGTYRVSDRPFAGARGVGQFDGTGLFFAVDGRSVRLRSSEPILDAGGGGGGPATAFVRFDPTSAPGARGLARVAVSDGADARGRSSADVAARADRPRRGPDSPARPVRSDDARTDADRLRAELERVSAERRALAAERDRLRAERDAAVDRGLPTRRARPEQTRDRTPSRTRWTRADRDDALDQARTREAALVAERDRMEADRDRLAAERDQLVAARVRAEAERDRLAVDLDAARRRAAVAEAAGARPRDGGAQTETARLRAEIAARDRALDALRTESEDRAVRLAETDAELGRAQRALLAAEAERTAAVAQRRSAAPGPAADRPLAERQRLLVQLADARAERDALALQVAVLQRERDGLRADLDRLASGRLADETGGPTADPIPRTPAVTPRAGAAATLPGFDFSRLRNPDVVRRRLDEAEYPLRAETGRTEGEVLVLFQTDPDGRVIRTAVASPIGGGLDALAESIVREMVFVAPVVSGLPTGLRSQVLVRFEM